MKEIIESGISLNNQAEQDAEKFISTEIQLRNILPEWISKACSLRLKIVLQKYFDCVQEYIQKLESFFEDEKIPFGDIKSRFMTTFIERTNEKLSHYSDGQNRDAFLLARVQSINQFKISCYGTAASLAKVLNIEKYAAVFHEAEVNEKLMEVRLSQLAEQKINIYPMDRIALAG